MADPLGPDLRLFVEELKAALPAVLPVAQGLDTSALQAQLEQHVDSFFRERYRKVEAEIAERTKNLRKSVDAKVANVKAFQGQEEEHIQRLMQQMLDQQAAQKQIISEIAATVDRRKTAAASARRGFEQQLAQLEEKLAKLTAETQELEHGRKQAPKIRVTISSPSIIQSEDKFYLIVSAKNEKDYDFANLSMQFSNGNGAYVQWIQREGEYVQYLPAHSECVLWAEAPQLQRGATVTITLTALWMLEEQGDVISNSVNLLI